MTKDQFPYTVKTANPSVFMNLAMLRTETRLTMPIAGFNSYGYAIEFARRHSETAPDLDTVIFIIHRDDPRCFLYAFQHGTEIRELADLDPSLRHPAQRAEVQP